MWPCERLRLAQAASIRLFFVREVAGFYVRDVLPDGFVDRGAEFGVAAEEAGFEFGRQAEHVVYDEDLPIDALLANVDWLDP